MVVVFKRFERFAFVVLLAVAIGFLSYRRIFAPGGRSQYR